MSSKIIVDSLCTDKLRFGSPSILLKVKNWKPPDFQKGFVTQSLESFTFLVSESLPESLYLDLSEDYQSYLLLFHLKAPFKVPCTLHSLRMHFYIIGFQCIFVCILYMW